MPLDQPSSVLIRRIASKELTLFFSSPIAYLFLATFAAVTLFVFFWQKAFFSRNIADVRPLFEAMPILLIFLSATLTMRLWSEERRSGTLEHVLTQPVQLWNFVLGKFVACLVLLGIALLITLPLPITVSLMGELDWGPVWAGYLAAFLLGAAYLSVGLFVSSRSDNQIVSLISATAITTLFYLLGTPLITDLVGTQAGEWLRGLGTGARFDSITRGVIDLRDLYYYLSIIAVFLILNTYTLEKGRWVGSLHTPHHKIWRTVSALLLVNVVVGNVWLGQLNSLRLDVTEGKQYSISTATQDYLDQLREPLLLRAYFSNKTHPLLSPLVPQLQDLMREYEIMGHGKVRVEFIDPTTRADIEEEANQKYGIEPVPFQVSDRYQAAIVNSYFNVLVQYGDSFHVLSFNDLIEVKARSEADFDVQLRNPEHDLTRAIKKVLNSYQAGGNLFETVQGDLEFTAYVSADAVLPEQLVKFKSVVSDKLSQLQEQSNGRLKVTYLDPDADGGWLGKQISENYGFSPMSTSVFKGDSFYFYMTLSQGDQMVQIPFEDMSDTKFERNLEAAVKRFAKGFTKTVALVVPEQMPAYDPFTTFNQAQFKKLEDTLGAELSVQRENLDDGLVSGDADVLLLVAPSNLNTKQLFAVDQFLMQGGTVILATSPYSVNFSNRRLEIEKQKSGLEDWLKHHGLRVDETMVLDPQNSAFPVPVTRQVGGVQVQEMRMLDYPYFIDVRGEGMNKDNPITANLMQVSIPWASPIVVDKAKNMERRVSTLLKSSNKSWVSESTDIMPRVTQQGLSAFKPEGGQKSRILALVSEGRFDSYFAGKESPLLNAELNEGDKSSQAAEADQDPDQSKPKINSNEAGVISSVIRRSPDSSRIILFSSNDFLQDQVTQLASAANGGEYLYALQLMANTVDWSLEDAGLLKIRSRSHFNRTLPPMEHESQLFWEYLNYGLAALALALVALVQRQWQKTRHRVYLAIMDNKEVNNE
ncbi:MAG TPA: Gldg family protein [Pseudomonadales bacterium]|nr:Gldg family protein [Pseudomonadales bacterium]